MKLEKNILAFLFVIFFSNLLYGQADPNLAPHEVLGVEKHADLKTIKKAYLELAKKWHPDRHQGSEEATRKFQEITLAYEILIGKSAPARSAQPPQPFASVIEEVFKSQETDAAVDEILKSCRY